MPLSAEERSTLVSLARRAVEAQVRGQQPPQLPQMKGALAEYRGCFVTLTNGGHLRGCIGQFQPAEPLACTVIEMGGAAAEDPRFYHRPITTEELPQLHIEVSVLSSLQETKDPLSLTIGVHGIYIVRNNRSGCFLPEVATDMGWDAQTFLDECCAGKAGMPPNAWKEKGTTVYLFTSEKFSG